jgi:hypothetical protein
MAAPIPATDLEEALFNSNLNIQSLHESSVNLKARLAAWREAFFPLIDVNDVNQAFIHRWIIPTIALEQELADTQVWFEVSRVVEIVGSALAASRWYGYVPAGAQETAMVAAYNTAWT